MNRSDLTSQSRQWLVSLALASALVLGPAATAQAAFPGAAGPIAYSKLTASEVEGAVGGIYVHGPKLRQGSRQLTSGEGDNSPAYSPDGRTIAFSSKSDPGSAPASHIFLMNADGSGVRALTSGEDYDSNPSFSPNGKQVVFDRAVGSTSRKTDIYVVNVDGSGVRQLTSGPGNDSEPTFAPNGKWIAFTSDRDHDVRSDRSDIFSMRPGGSHLRVLIDGPRNESEPDISPDGRRIAFVSNRDHGPNIYVASSNGRNAHALTSSKHDCFRSICYLSPSWAPDGKHIACLSSSRYDSRLEVMRPDGSQRKEFASGGTEEEGYGTSLGPPAWGPVPH